ncbi:transposase [Moorella sp. Hama-1]|uniref:ISNCY family transposase n=1 Tax=Moorella sp. Hama-1 TaxID=2138101 RepID=UPI0020561A9B|nr:ISNCY family transposase [Moorella sp. Hama-1]BCV21730.1 transposase [Moorella sp. Hama-1]
MSAKESRRVFVIEKAIEGKITNRQAAEVLGLTERQVIRLKERMKAEGVAGLAHKNRGRIPKHAVPKDTRKKVVMLARGPLRDASCQQVAELLEEFYETILSAKTVGRILKEAGIPLAHTHRAPKRQKSRDRMPQEGLLSQIDASPFAWLEDRGPELALHGSIDDATGKVQGLHFELHECLHGYLQLLSQVVQNCGVPRSLYSDRHTIFFSPKGDRLSIEEELAGQTAPLTQFGRAISELGINHIKARSPQAKGRIERLWGTLQGRLMIELRLAGISTLEAANAFLPGFRERFNRRFTVAPADPAPAYAPCPPPARLKQILSTREDRKASRGSSISYLGRTYQLVDTRDAVVPLRPRATVEVLTHLDGSLSALYGGNYYALQEFTPAPAVKAEEPKKAPASKAHTPAPDHPWRRIPINQTKKAMPLPVDNSLPLTQEG